MGKRRSGGATDEIVGIVSGLPWQAGVALAVVAFLVAHHFAAAPASTAPPQMNQLGEFVIGAGIRVVADILQYVLPALCLIAAGVSAIKQSKRRALAHGVADAKDVGALDGMTWREFEQLVGEAFRMRGYAISEVGGGGPDGGVDLVLTKAGERFLVQCKHWKALKVGVDVVRELYGVMAARGATGGFVITSGTFTTAAEEFAAGRNLKLVAGSQLVEMIARAKRVVGGAARAGDGVGASEASRSSNVAACPVCGAPMLLRIAKRGANAGGQFWGCSRYPKCRGTKPV